MTIPWYAWLFVILAPIVCGLAGAATLYVALIPRRERALDAAYSQGWDECLAHDAPGWQHYAQEQMSAASDRTDEALSAPVAATEGLEALPAVHHEGGRHERPHSPVWTHDDLAALARVREQFARIRIGLGLWA